jgi:hypothetical protein
MFFGMVFLPHLIKFYRKTPDHKACYVPVRKGLMRLNDDPYVKLMSQSEGYGVFYPPKGKAYV